VNQWATFDEIVQQQIAAFPSSRFCRRITDRTVRVSDYQTALTTIFHQARSSAFTFARASVNCGARHEAAKDYLLRHAEEERTHWRWILEDLAATGYTGVSPRERFPHATCQAYVGLNYFVAEEMPIARLATACVLEGIGATHGGSFGGELLRTLGLSSSQASFFLNHGETDRGHAQELREVVRACHLLEEEWHWMHYAAETAGRFYRDMYDHEGYE
jgi:hypothetical protein